MFHRIWTLYTVELQKALRMKQTFAGPLLLGILILCAPLLHPIASQYYTNYDQLANQAYGLIAFITPRALGLLGLLFTLLFSAALISPELHSGNLRQIFVRPLRRHEFVIAKLLVGCSYAVFLLLITAALSWALAFALCHMHGGRLSGITFGGELIFTSNQMRNAYLAGLLLSAPPFFAIAAFGLMISSLTRSTVQAIGLAMGLWIILETIKYPLHLDRFIFFSYLEKPWQVFIQQCDGMEGSWFPMLGESLAAAAAAILLCTAAAILVTQRRNISV